MRKLVVSLGLAVALLVAQGCGFRPLYGEQGLGRNILPAVNIDAGEGRSAYLMRQELLTALGARESSSAPRLIISLRESRRGFGVRVDDIATRFELSMRGVWSLTGPDGTGVIASGTHTGTAIFDVPDNPYAGIRAEEDARERAVAMLAQEIVRALEVKAQEAPLTP